MTHSGLISRSENKRRSNERRRNLGLCSLCSRKRSDRSGWFCDYHLEMIALHRQTKMQEYEDLIKEKDFEIRFLKQRIKVLENLKGHKPKESRRWTNESRIKKLLKGLKK